MNNEARNRLLRQKRGSKLLFLLLWVIASILCDNKFWNRCQAFQQAGNILSRNGSHSPHLSKHSRPAKESILNGDKLFGGSDSPLLDSDILESTQTFRGHFFDRRQFVSSIATAVVLLPLTSEAAENVAPENMMKSLEDIELGNGSWTKLRRNEMSSLSAIDHVVPADFCTYLTRFLIQYDDAVAAWWDDLIHSYSFLSEDQQKVRLSRNFGSFAATIRVAVDTFVHAEPSAEAGFAKLLHLLLECYRVESAQRHIGILFALLPKDIQPIDTIRQSLATSSPLYIQSKEGSLIVPSLLTKDLSALLPNKYRAEFGNGNNFLTIQPPLGTQDVGIDDELGPAVIATLFGPLATQLLTRELPSYSPYIYALFGISGASGCALTHSFVIPLDVVKTRAQTNSTEYSGVITSARKIIQEEGVYGLLTGAQATIAGYFWYGLSVYPSYSFFKRFLGRTLLPENVAVAHANEIALIAGALAAVIASFGLTPLEAARIRVVAEPERYKPLGLVGTLQSIAKEDSQYGWKAIYAGLPSLMTRQVIFGSVKFLAFEQACICIFNIWPFLRDATWTTLMVSLVAGGLSGFVSAVVSQPADAVLTYVAQKSIDQGTLGVIEGCKLMVNEMGLQSLYRGFGSRCLWAGSIIAGQFLLYDVFRNYFRVTSDDLSQVFHMDIGQGVFSPFTY